MRTCGGCRFCCWSFNVLDVPDEIKGLTIKEALTHCKYECDTGCAIHQQHEYPKGCKDFICPYLEGEDIYRPDVFQKVIEECGGDTGNFIPRIPTTIPTEKVHDLIKETRSVPAFILVGQWSKVILSLDRHADQSWNVSDDVAERWKQLISE